MRIEVAPRALLGIQEIGPSSFNDEMNAGSKFGDSMWAKFIPMVGATGLSLEREMFGVSWPADELTPPQHIHYFVGFELPEGFTHPEFEHFELPGGGYFSYTYTGSMQEVDRGFADAYMNALPASGLTPREGLHLEVYPADYDPTASEVTFQILIPVE